MKPYETRLLCSVTTPRISSVFVSSNVNRSTVTPTDRGRFLAEGVQRGGVQAVRVQRGEHGEPQFTVPDGHAADRVLGERPREVEDGLATRRHGRVLQRELLQEQRGGRLVHDRLVHGPVPVRQGRVLRRVRIPVHVHDVVGKYSLITVSCC